MRRSPLVFKVCAPAVATPTRASSSAQAVLARDLPTVTGSARAKPSRHTSIEEDSIFLGQDHTLYFLRFLN
jgi:hypothetical protein